MWKSLRDLSKWAPLGVAAALMGGLVRLATRSEGLYWLDDYQHLLYSRHAPDHPSLLLDIWGRPLMTATYVPAAQIGEGAVRFTSLLILAGTAVLCWRIATGWRTAMPGAAAVFLVAQPKTAELAMGAMPQTTFCAVLALALFLRARGHDRAATVVASLLPLARLEGVIVLAVWGLVLLWERRWRLVPLLACGIGGWWFAALLLYGDPLWLITENGFVTTSSAYGAAGWGFVFDAVPPVFGVVVPVLAAIGLVGRRWKDVLVPAIAVGLIGFYIVVWGTGAFQTGRFDIYLVSAAVPVALLAQSAISWIVDSREQLLLAGVNVVLIVAVLGYREFDPLPLKASPAAAAEVARSLEGDAPLVQTHPAVGWYSGRPPATWGFFDATESVRGANEVVWDSVLGPSVGVTVADLRRMGFERVESATYDEQTVAIFRRPG